MHKKRNIPTTGKVLAIERALTVASRNWLYSQPRPDRLFGRRVPESLDGLSLGDLLALQGISGENNRESVEAIVRIITKTHVPTWCIMATRSDKVFGLVAFAVRELERIGRMFKNISHEPNEDEIAAGVNDLDSGPFGLVDWYARRMGYKDHDEVLHVPWLRVWQTVKIDADRDEYERRLRDVINAKYKVKK